MTLRALRVLLFILPACFHDARAAEAVANVNLRFLVLDETGGAYFIKDGSSSRPLDSTPYAVGGPVVTKSAAEIEIFKAVPAPATAPASTASPSSSAIAGGPACVKVATLSVPVDTTGALVVLTPRAIAAGAPPACDVSIYDNDPRRFPPHSIRILNLGRAAMAAQFGDVRVVTPPGGVEVVQPKTDARNRVFGKIAVQPAAGVWELLYNRITILRPAERVTGIFVYSPTGLRHTYTERELKDRDTPPAAGHFWLTYGEIL